MVSTRSNTTTVVSTAIAPPSSDFVVPANSTTTRAVDLANADGPPTTGPATGSATSAFTNGSTAPIYASREERMNEAATKIKNKLDGINDKDEQSEYLKTTLLSQHGNSIDLWLKHNQKAHQLAQAGREIRARDLHLRVLRNKLLHQMDLQNRRLIAQTAQRISNPYSAKIDEWFSNNQIERIVLRPEGQASRSRARITRSATSRSSRHGMMVQKLGTQVVDGKRVASRVNLEQQVVADLEAKLRNAKQYVEVLQHKYDVLQVEMPPPVYEATQCTMGHGTA